MEYAEQAKSWISGTLKRFGNSIPTELRSLNYENMSDDQLENYSKALYSVFDSKQAYHVSNNAPAETHKQMLYLIPHEASDGSVTFIDRYTGRVVAGAQRMSNGLFGYYGPRDMLEVFFGRGGLDRMWARTEDNKFFRDEPKK